jgi:hypothetical protein
MAEATIRHFRCTSLARGAGYDQFRDIRIVDVITRKRNKSGTLTRDSRKSLLLGFAILLQAIAACTEIIKKSFSSAQASQPPSAPDQLTRLLLCSDAA